MRKKKVLERELSRAYIVLIVSLLALILVVSLFFLELAFPEPSELEGELVTKRDFIKVFESILNIVINITAPNAPQISIVPELYVCEADFLSYYFNVTDINGDRISVGISPSDPFYVSVVSILESTVTRVELFSGILDKSDAGGVGSGGKLYRETVFANDGTFVDSEQVNITVIEINNPPSVENIGVQTVWLQGANSSFYKQVQVNDVEDGNQDSGNLTFNITILNSTGPVKLFNLTQNGIMNYTPSESELGIYNITLCVKDRGIGNPHQNISLCGQDGSNITLCRNFTLTVTDENRAPVIVNHYPLNLTLGVSGTAGLFFNITKYDPDETIPDAYWYVDGVLMRYDSGSSYDEFNYSFGCGISGAHFVRVDVTDGSLNDSIQWNLTVSLVGCPEPPDGGGGGGGGVSGCTEKWACYSWSICKHVEDALKDGILLGEEYRLMKDVCVENNWAEEYCGVQTKNCIDVNYCNTTYSDPPVIQDCFYTERPTCNDRITNCHDGDCEVLVDCGGPCEPCPSCGDGIQNQGEGGIDCEGPCPVPCPVETPLKRIKLEYVLIAIFFIVVLVIVILITLRKIVKIRKILSLYR